MATLATRPNSEAFAGNVTPPEEDLSLPPSVAERSLASSLTGRRIAITGGAGFIGTALVRRLAGPNEVRVLDLGIHGQPSHASPEGVETLIGDVREPETVAAFVAGADIVIHLASIAGVKSVLRNPVSTMETILLGSHNVLRAVAVTPGVHRVIMFSTSEVAGRFAHNAAEDATMVGVRGGELRWTYAAAKLATEFEADAFHHERGVPTTCLRPFNVYGPGQLGSGAIREFVSRAVAGEPMEVRGDGSRVRCWCFVDDIVRAVELCCVREQAVGRTFNIGNPRTAISVYDLARLIKRIAGSASPLKFVDNLPVDVDSRVPDISRARTLLGFVPRVGLEEGIARTLEAVRTRR
jgi:UDP-glucose 4-epimerase